MGFSCGIVGLPNVGKSTLFNAVTNSKVEASNYPFCTIEPNSGVVAVPDKRLQELARIMGSAKSVPTTVNFTDIAGLVKGASQGEGLGNQFLAHIRETDAIMHVIRLFRDEKVVREGSSDPVSDLELIFTELILADLATCEKRMEKAQKLFRSQNDATARKTIATLEKVKENLEQGTLLKQVEFSDNELDLVVRECCFLTIKPMLVVANIDEGGISSFKDDASFQALQKFCEERDMPVVELSAKIEQEISEQDDGTRAEYLEMMGLEVSGLDRLVLAGYKLLDLMTFFTANESQASAWTVKTGTAAPDAAGVIHTDFKAGFIKAEVVGIDVLIEQGSYAACRDAGKVRLEGKNYVVQEGDVCLFKVNR